MIGEMSRPHRTPLPWLMLLLAAAGCEVVDAPEDIEELVTWGFEHFQEQEEYMVAMGDNLLPQIDERFDEVSEGWRVDNLADRHLEAAGVESPDTVSIVGALGAVDYEHELHDVICLVHHPQKDELWPDYYVSYEVTEDTDRGCFLAGDCDDYEAVVEQSVEVPFLGLSTQTLTRQVRWIHPDDGEAYVVERVLSPTPVVFDTEILEVDQQYSFVLLVPHGTGTRRVETFWVEARFLDAEVPDYFAVENAVSSMHSQVDRIDRQLSDFGCE
jgi:hypothetical protein